MASYTEIRTLPMWPAFLSPMFATWGKKHQYSPSEAAAVAFAVQAIALEIQGDIGPDHRRLLCDATAMELARDPKSKQRVLNFLQGAANGQQALLDAADSRGIALPPDLRSHLESTLPVDDRPNETEGRR